MRHPVAWAAAYVVLSCGNPTGVDKAPTPVVAAVVVDPATATLQVGADQSLHAIVTDETGGATSGASVVWSVRDPGIASVSTTGVVTARAPGTTQVAASANGKSGTAAVTVQPASVASVIVSPSPLSLTLGQTRQLSVVMRDARGADLGGRAVNWASANTAVATVSADGIVTAAGIGTTVVTTTSEGISSGTTVTVTPVPVAAIVVQPATATLTVGQTTALGVTLKDATGAVLDGTDRPLAWSSSDDAVLRVSATGVVTGVAPGTATITATREGVAGSSAVTVTRVPVSTVAILPLSPSVTAGQTVTFAATVTDANGTLVSDRVVTWTSSNTLVASVGTSTGVVTGIASGSAVITATSEGKSGSTTVTVTALSVGSIAIEPANPTLVIGSKTTLTATVRDAAGAVVTDRAVTWSSSNLLVANVSQTTGVVTAVAPGSATISATSEGKSGGTTVTVTLVPVGSVVIQPSVSSVVVGQTNSLATVVKDANGVVVLGRIVSWASSNILVATVSASGVVTGVSPGTSTITAKSEEKIATATVTVTRAPVGNVVVQPVSSSLAVGQMANLAATVSDTRSVIVTDRLVTWSSSNDLVATVSSTGVVTGVKVGSATITATSEGVSGSAAVAVTAVAVLSVRVRPDTALFVGQTAVLSATVTDANGNVVTDRPLTWSSSNNSVATVSLTGVVTAKAPGSVTIGVFAGGKTGSATVIVTLVPVQSVTLPSSTTVMSGLTTTLIPIVKDVNGTVVIDRLVTWASSNPLVATVSANGVVSGVSSGTATITATSEGKVGSTTLTVTPVPVKSVTVAPPTVGLVISETTRLAATVKDLNGTVVTDRLVTWMSDNPLVATVSSTGVVTAIATGTVLITASSEGWNGSSTVTVTKVPVGSVTLPPTMTLPAGARPTLIAIVKDTAGTVVTDRLVTWFSSNALVATVSSTGVVRAVATGSATITATSETKSGSTILTVTSAPVGSVTVLPSTTTIVNGQTVQLNATVRDTTSAIVTDRVVTWVSSNPLVATVSATGFVSTLSAGSATITATSEVKSGSAALTVTPVPVGSVTLPLTTIVVSGQTTTLTPIVKDANGTVVTDRVVTWTSSNSLVATVSASGVVTGASAGTATITATSEGKMGSSATTVTPVTPVPVGSVTVAPATKSIVVRTTTTLTPTVKDANGTIVTNRVVTWSSSNDLVATVSTTGVVTGVSAGSATITATSEGRSGSSAITITPVPVASVTVAPLTVGLVIGQTATLVATVKDANGTVVTDRLVTWVSNNTLVATVSSTGVVTAVGVGGPVFVTASSEGWNGSSSVTVTKVPVGTVTLPPAATLPAGGKTTLVPVVKDTSGTVVTDRVVTWTSSNTLVATVSSTGLVTAVATGTATITATSETKSGSTVLTVTPAPVGSVTVLPASVTKTSSTTVQIAATVRDTTGAVVTDRVVTWTSSNPVVATVSASGLVSALKTGVTLIIATSETKSDTSTVTVTAGAAAVVTLTPASVTIVDSQSRQLTASAVDANGNAITGRSFTWTSSNNQVASVSIAGLVKANKPGLATITASLDNKTASTAVTVTP